MAGKSMEMKRAHAEVGTAERKMERPSLEIVKLVTRYMKTNDRSDGKPWLRPIWWSRHRIPALGKKHLPWKKFSSTLEYEVLETEVREVSPNTSAEMVLNINVEED